MTKERKVIDPIELYDLRKVRGYTYAALQEHFGVGKAVIRDRLRALGLATKQPTKTTEKLSNVERWAKMGPFE